MSIYIEDGAAIAPGLTEIIRFEAPTGAPHEDIAKSSILKVLGKVEASTPHRHKYPSRLAVIIETHGDDQPNIEFDIQDVTNQAGWTANQAGLLQAVTDISTWLQTGGGTGAIVAVLNTMLAEMQDDVDFEMKLVKDKVTGAVYCMIKEMDQGTQVVTTRYEDADGNPVVPANPLEFIDPTVLLQAIDNNLVLAIGTLGTINSTIQAGNLTLIAMDAKLNGIQQTMFDSLTFEHPLQIDDNTTAGVTYIGYALPGTPTNAALWAIKKIDETGPFSVITWADGNFNQDNVYDDRATTVVYS